MYQSEFLSTLKSKPEFKSLFFYGECEYRMDVLAAKFFKAVGAHEIEKLYFDEYSFKTLKSTLSQPSLFSPTNAVLIKSDKKFKDKELKEAVDICFEAQASYAVFIYQKSPNKNDREYYKNAASLSKAFSKAKNSASIRLFKTSERDAYEAMSEVVDDSNVEFDKSKLLTIFNYQNQDLALAIAELKKMLLHSFEDGGVLQEYSMGVINLDELVSSLIEKKDSEALLYNLQRVLEEGYTPIEIVIAFQSKVRELFNFYAYIRSTGKLDKLEILGNPKYPDALANKSAEIAMRLGGENIYRIFDLLLECSLDIKENKGDAYSVLVSTLMKIKALVR
jgi:DNA polymerase III delta subunit